MTRTLTLENMDNVSLQGIFDSRAMSSDPREIYRIQKYRLICGIKEKITLGDVYRLFDQGLKFHEVKEALCLGDSHLYRDIENKTVLIGEAFYNAVNPGIKGFKKSNIIKVLCDENLDEHITTHAAQIIFGCASHIAFEGLTSEPDSIVWKTALAGYDIIISKDTAQKAGLKEFHNRDLTNCAYDAWRDVFMRNGGVIDDEIRSLPIIIHITDAQATGRDIKKMLQRHKTDIYNLLQQRKSPLIKLGKGRKPVIGDHYLELIDGGTKARKKKLLNLLLGRFMSENSLGLNRYEKITQRTTIRSFIREGIEDFSRQYPNPEERIPALNHAIHNSNNYPLMSDWHFQNLKKTVHNSRYPRKDRFSKLEAT